MSDDGGARVVRVTLNDQQMELVRELVADGGFADPSEALVHGLRASARADQEAAA